MTTKEIAEGQPIRILVVLAHPDDPDFFCGGTVARWSAEGREIFYCLLTRGDKGVDNPDNDPEKLAKIRMKEQRAAAKVLGVREVFFMDNPDGFLVPDLNLRREVVRVIRRLRPEIVVTCDPTNFFPSDRYINHPDHRAAGQATLDAVFPAAGLGSYFPELQTEDNLEPHKVSQVYVAGAQHPNTVVNVSRFFDLKLEALTKHRSQIHSVEELEKSLRDRMLDPQSPPDAPRYIERFKRIDLRR